jgi:hypothetical protein
VKEDLIDVVSKLEDEDTAYETKHTDKHASNVSTDGLEGRGPPMKMRPTIQQMLDYLT